jgi:ABC-type multidrug transport system fused ATPase/permease subunit
MMRVDAASPAPRRVVLEPLRRLWGHLGRVRRVQALMVLGLTVVTSLLEIAAIGATLPFLAALVSPESLGRHALVAPTLQRLAIDTPAGIQALFSATFAAAALSAGLSGIALVYAATRFTFACGADLSDQIFRRTLHQPYSVHVGRNSSDVIAGISTKSQALVDRVVGPCIGVASTTILMVMILGALIAYDPLAALSMFGGFAAIYVSFAALSRRRLLADGAVVAEQSGRVVQILQEALGGIRDVLVDGSQGYYARLYRDADRQLRRSQGRMAFVGTSPRRAVEALGMLLIAGLAVWMSRSQEDGIAGALPTLGTLVLAAQRLLPLLQEAYWSISCIVAAQPTLRDLLELLDQPMPADAERTDVPALPFEQSLRLAEVGFRYDAAGPWVLSGVDLVVERGERIGLIGASGTGKSTLLDLIMGLSSPSTGRLEVDGVPVLAANRRGWQRHIAHVPQSIHLADSSLAENIAFGVPPGEIDLERVRDAARRARIADTIDALPQGYDTRAGERGARLSGGQRQRIGLARALYKRADVLVLDEATSALDEATERAVMQTIEALGDSITVIVVAHRLSTLRHCSRVLELRAGRLVETGVANEAADAT